MNARCNFTLLIAVTAGCATEPAGSAFRVDRLELTDTGAPYFMAGALGRVANRVDDGARALAPALPAIADALKLSASDLAFTRVDRDQLGMAHVRYAQQLNGLRVVGGEVVVHVGADGAIGSVTSSARDGAGAVTQASIDRDAALRAARDAVGAGDTPASELVYQIANRDGELRLAWEVLVAVPDQLIYDLVYVDARSGGVIERHPQVYTARNRRILDGMGQSVPVLFPPAPQIGSEGQPPTDTAGRAAYDGTGATYDCYKMLYNRDSYDNAGAVLESIVHVVFPTQGGGTTGGNAAWLDVALLGISQMAYGDGGGKMGPTANGFDVTAHELTHAVTSRTAKLAYMNESGALNEASSDIMAAVCEAWKDGAVSADTWLVGEDIWTVGTPGDALRYMADPTKDKDLYPPELGGSRDFYADRYTGTQDNGGVHLNSGIANLAFYLASAGGKHPQNKTTFMVPGIGIDKAGAIWQRALVMGYFTAGTTFAQARTATEQAAMELHGGSAKLAIGMAWAAVGIGMPPEADLVPPTVEITSPADGAKVAPGFVVSVNANDNVGVVKVELTLDGAMVGSANAGPYSFTTDSALATGSHTLVATAYDAFNQASDQAMITIEIGGGGGGGDDDGEGGAAAGCCDTGHGSPAGALALALGTLLALRKRRRA